MRKLLWRKSSVWTLLLVMLLATGRAQTLDGPLSLEMILTGLQAQATDNRINTLEKRNRKIEEDVGKVGVTFQLTEDIINALHEAGADEQLIAAIRAAIENNPGPSPPPDRPHRPIVPPRSTPSGAKPSGTVKKPKSPTPSGANYTQALSGLPANVKQLEMVAIPAGSFMMGSTGTQIAEANKDCSSCSFDGEKPRHEVTVAKPFFMGKYEVTQAQWQAVMGSNPSYFKNCPDCPVEQVSWEEAQQFIDKLNAQVSGGGKYRLPTEAEWEYAARAGTEGPYAGNLDEMAWYDSSSGNKTHPVRQKKANKFGLYDMHGNVYEWVQDWYGPYSSKAETDPHGPGTGSYRVKRGGSWNSSAAYARAANRGFLAPSRRAGDLGFRLSRTPAPDRSGTSRPW